MTDKTVLLTTHNFSVLNVMIWKYKMVASIVNSNYRNKKKQSKSSSQTHRLRRDASRHTLSGSMPALSFSWATMNTPRSWYDVYTVKNTIIAKYVSSVKYVTPMELTLVLSARNRNTV